MVYLRKNQIKSAKQPPHLYIWESKKEGKDQESIQSSTTPDPGYQWESDNVTNKSQEVSPFPAGDHKASTNRRAWKDIVTKQDRNNINDPQKKHRLGTVSMEGNCTHKFEDWNDKSIKWKCGDSFWGRHTAQTKTTLIIKVRKRAKIRNRYNQAPHLTQDFPETPFPETLDLPLGRQLLWSADNLCKQLD